MPAWVRVPIRASRARMLRGGAGVGAARSALPRRHGPVPRRRLRSVLYRVRVYGCAGRARQTRDSVVSGGRRSPRGPGRKPSSMSTAPPCTAAPHSLDEVDWSRPGRAAGGEHVVDEQHPVTRRRSRPGASRASPRRTRARRRRRASRAGACRPCAPARSRRPRASATGAARMKPRASMPSTLSTTDRAVARRARRGERRRPRRRSRSGSASSGVMSLKTSPGSGKSGTSAIRRSSSHGRRRKRPRSRSFCPAWTSAAGVGC